MNKLIKSSNIAVWICVVVIVVLVCVFCIMFYEYNNEKSSITSQQQWSSGKEDFDKAYEIAAADKDTPDKTLYIPSLINLLDKNFDEAIANIGKDAVLTGVKPIDPPQGSIVSEVSVNLTRESANIQTGSTVVVFGIDANNIIKKVSFSCNAELLGYGKLSFTDIINNEHIIEKAYRECGLMIPDGTIITPANRSLYTTYESDGTTVSKESATFSGSTQQDGTTYSWNCNLTYDYSLANKKGNLASTIRNLTISIEH